MLELFATALLRIAAFIALQVWEMKALLAASAFASHFPDIEVVMVRSTKIGTIGAGPDPWMVARGEHAETPPRSPGGLVAGVRAGCVMRPEMAASISRVGGDRSGPPGRTVRSHRGRARSGPTTRRSG